MILMVHDRLIKISMHGLQTFWETFANYSQCCHIEEVYKDANKVYK